MDVDEEKEVVAVEDDTEVQDFYTQFTDERAFMPESFQAALEAIQQFLQPVDPNAAEPPPPPPPHVVQMLFQILQQHPNLALAQPPRANPNQASNSAPEALGIVRNLKGIGSSVWTCGHVAHKNCIEESIRTSRANERVTEEDIFINNSLYEFKCPVCRRIMNSFVPLIPKNIEGASEKLNSIITETGNRAGRVRTGKRSRQGREDDTDEHGTGARELIEVLIGGLITEDLLKRRSGNKVATEADKAEVEGIRRVYQAIQHWADTSSEASTLKSQVSQIFVNTSNNNSSNNKDQEANPHDNEIVLLGNMVYNFVWEFLMTEGDKKEKLKNLAAKYTLGTIVQYLLSYSVLKSDDSKFIHKDKLSSTILEKLSSYNNSNNNNSGGLEYENAVLPFLRKISLFNDICLRPTGEEVAEEEEGDSKSKARNLEVEELLIKLSLGNSIAELLTHYQSLIQSYTPFWVSQLTTFTPPTAKPKPAPTTSAAPQEDDTGIEEVTDEEAARIWNEAVESEKLSNNSNNTSDEKTNVSNNQNDVSRKALEQVQKLLELASAELKFIELPTQFRDVFNAFSDKACKNCNTKPVGGSGSVCLVCGEFVCAMRECCSQNGLGELFRHTLKCGGGNGVYIMVSASTFFVISDDRSCFWGSPYVDKFGEEDLFFERGKELNLNKDVLEHIERMFLANRLDDELFRADVAPAKKRRQARDF
eukprot:TRINITY_DN469_c1_g1_i1.p1 TRINITY_DN469_c1_g1~~TRINITY_DN469_c1_g1_i1.p1  ORF type:complete len:721 (-),score=243.97 TRINITY_DN469_c1_g1_i1:56-2170(-)